MNVEAWLTLVLALQGPLAADAATLPAAPISTGGTPSGFSGADPAGAANAAAGCPTIHVYLDLSGSVLKPLPEQGQQTGYKLALERLRTSVAPHIDGMGAMLLLYRFGGEVDNPISFRSTEQFVEYLGELERGTPARRGATNLTHVWKHMLARARGAAGLQSFFVFSDFAQSSIVAPAPPTGAGQGGNDEGDDLRDWRVFLAETGEAIRAAVDNSFVRLVRLPAQQQYQERQKRTLAYLTNLGSRVRVRVVDVAAPDWDDFGKQTRYVDLQLEDGRLRLRNMSCVVVTAEALRLRRADGSTFPERRPPLELGKGATGYWDMPSAGVVRVGVAGNVPGIAGGLLSDELSLGLRTGDLSAFAFVFGKTLQVFITPKVPLGAAIEGSVEVLASTDAGEKPALQGRVRIPENAAAHAAPLRGKLLPADVEAVSSGRVRLRLTPEMGNPIEVTDVPVMVLPGVQFDLRWIVFVVLLLSFLAVAFLVRVSGWRRWPQALSGLTVLAALAALGKWSVYLDAEWVVWLSGLVATLLGAWCGWCTVVAVLPAERRTIRQVAALIDKSGTYRHKLLSRWAYTQARLVGLGVALAAGGAAWWLLRSTYAELGEQRLPLYMLQKVVEGVLTGQG